MSSPLRACARLVEDPHLQWAATLFDEVVDTAPSRTSTFRPWIEWTCFVPPRFTFGGRLPRNGQIIDHG